MTDWNAYRQLFPHTRSQVFMNHAAVSPYSSRVVDALNEHNRVRSDSDNLIYFPDFLDKKTRFKQLIGSLINAPVENIARVENTSAGLSVLANGLAWRPGDRILLNNFEFPANIYPFVNLERLGVVVDFVQHKNGRIDPADIAAAIRPETRLLSISFVQFLNGFQADLKAISNLCRQHDLIFSVDGIQGVGAMQLDVQALGIDFLANGGHKWLMWPMGTGYFYISPRIFDRVYPSNAGWLAVKNAWEFSTKFELNFLPTAERFEPSGFNVPGLIGAVPALEMMHEIGPARIEQKILATTNYLIEKLHEHGYEIFTITDDAHRSGIVTFEHKRAQELWEFLEKQKVFVSIRAGKIRVSPHFYNNEDDVDQLLRGLREFDKK